MISWTSIILLAAFGASLINDGISSLVAPQEYYYIVPVISEEEEEDDVPLCRPGVVQPGDSVDKQEQDDTSGDV